MHHSLEDQSDLFGHNLARVLNVSDPGHEHIHHTAVGQGQETEAFLSRNHFPTSTAKLGLTDQEGHLVDTGQVVILVVFKPNDFNS